MVIKNISRREQFNPTILGIFFNPFYFARREISKNIKSFSGYIKEKVLDVGCGTKPYKSFFKSKEYIGLEIKKSGDNCQSKNVDVFYDGKKFPFTDDNFDSIVCFEVLEHVFNPNAFIKEMRRVLKKGGYILLSTPFMWDEHETPHDFCRYSSFGLKEIFKKNKFKIIKNKKYLTDFRLLFLLANDYFYKVSNRIFPGRFQILFLPLYFLVNLLGHLAYILPQNKDLYFGNIIVLKK